MTNSELAMLEHSKELLNIKRTPYGYLHVTGDRRAEALFADAHDLDINDHKTVAKQVGLKPGMNVLDIGAYIGDSAIAYLREGCNVTAFEPFLDTFLCLMFNTRHYRDSVRCRMVPIGNGEMIDLDYSYSESDCGCRFVKHNGSVQAVRIDDHQFYPKIDFIKIDVEGHEMHVIRGAQKTIMRDRPILFVESFPDALSRTQYTPDMLHKLIESMGYNIGNREGKPFKFTNYVQMEDLLCVPK